MNSWQDSIHNGERNLKVPFLCTEWRKVAVCPLSLFLCQSFNCSYLCKAGYSQAFVPGMLYKVDQTNQLVSIFGWLVFSLPCLNKTNNPQTAVYLSACCQTSRKCRKSIEVLMQEEICRIAETPWEEPIHQVMQRKRGGGRDILANI